MTEERERWNAKFLAGEAQSADPDPLLVEICSGLRPGCALDIGGGAGRHALWLGQRGWRVVLADISDEGLAIAERRSAAAGIALSLRRESAAETVAWAIEEEMRFDLVLVFWLMVRDQFAVMPRLLNPGGMLIYKTYNTGHPRFGAGHSRRFALHPGELAAAFPGLQTVHYRESEGIAELVARAG